METKWKQDVWGHTHISAKYWWNLGHFKGWILLGRPDTVSYRKQNTIHDTDKDPKWVISFGSWRYIWRYVATLSLTLEWLDAPKESCRRLVTICNCIFPSVKIHYHKETADKRDKRKGGNMGCYIGRDFLQPWRRRNCSHLSLSPFQLSVPVPRCEKRESIDKFLPSFPHVATWKEMHA